MVVRLPIHPWDHFWEQYYRYDALVHENGTVTSRVPRWAIDEQLHGLETLRLDALPEMARSRALIVRATVGMLGPDQGFMLPAAEAGQVTAAMVESRLVEIPGTNHYTIIVAPELAREVAGFLEERSRILEVARHS